MERSPEDHDGLSGFTHINLEGDLDLLRALVPGRDAIDADWLSRVGSYMDVGSQRLESLYGSSQTTLKQRGIINARRAWEGELGLRTPTHPIHDAYMKCLQNRAKQGLIPAQMFGALKALAVIGGCPAGALNMVRQSPYLLMHSGMSLHFRFNYMSMIASALKWQGNVSELVQTKPDMLLVGHKMIAVLAQLAGRFASEDQRTLDCETVGRIFKRLPIEGHLETIAEKGADYVFGQWTDNRARRSAAARRDHLYELLASPEVVKRLGGGVLHAYFRYRKPTAAALEAHDHLASLYASKPILASPEVAESNPPSAVTGDESWLSEITTIPKRSQGAWLAKLNRTIAAGSARASQRWPEDPKYEEIINERIAFFRLLGWTNSNSKIGRAFELFSLQTASLTSPQKVVDILNELTQYRVRPIVPLVARRFKMLLYHPDTIRKKLDIILEEGFDVNSALHWRPTLLTETPDRARAILRKQNERWLSPLKPLILSVDARYDWC